MIVDAHTHVWGPDALELDWLADPTAGPLRRPYPVGELLAEEAACGVDAVVLVTAVESVAGTAALLAEVERDDASRAAPGAPRAAPRIGAVVGWVDLTAPGVGGRLDALRAGPGGRLLRGVRLVQEQVEPGRRSTDALLRACDALAERGLVLEVLVAPGRLADLAELVDARPELPVVLDHLGGPSPDAGEAWRLDLFGLAHAPRVFLKLSGLDLRTPFGADCAAFALDLFGPRRVMAGSDWPVLRLRSTLEAVWSDLAVAAAGLTSAERDAVLGGTAAEVYGIDHQGGTP
ncbi:amidohydrolase family protein [Leifsonia sp. F6_8S_P_1B]|uniref:Amidohydrolase family protein n=1 Tax=Leifsonia williamsii TaxID=3035919 RepID=A0ABT8KAW3_9MICO|nr:amidohydrolase family protein [Leifsonia williamsii]MDN4614561.1 amidohydrolase family protein [Leifsonia williamsii]